MSVLLRKYWYLTGAVLLLFGSAAFAQTTTTTITLTGVGDGANAGGVFVDPYTAAVGTMTNVSVICDDWSDETNIGETWIANVNTISPSLTGSPLFGQSLGSAGQQALYNEAAWLASQLLAIPINNPTPAQETAQIEISYALWELTCSTTTTCAGQPFSVLSGVSSADLAGAQNYLTEAEGEGGFNASGWEILTPTPESSNEPQEFLVYMPESSPGIALGADLLGLLGLVIIFRRRLLRPIL